MIRIPLLGIHAPWPVLLAAAVLMVLMLAAAGAALVLWPLPLELTAAWSRLRRYFATVAVIVAALALTARQLLASDGKRAGRWGR